MTWFDTTLFNSFDPQDVALNPRDSELYVLDGTGSEVYVISPGADGVYNGVPPAGDDILVTHFDTSAIGISGPEGIGYGGFVGGGAAGDSLLIVGPSNPNLLVEAGDNGQLLKSIDISFLNAVAPSGVSTIPCIQSGHSVPTYVFITDRGSAFQEPYGNDGKIYEINLYSGATPTPSPTPVTTCPPPSPTLLRTIDTSQWPAPDPGSIDEDVNLDSFFISDPKVDEIPGSINLFRLGYNDILRGTYSTLAFSDEPTGVSAGINNQKFFSDSSQKRVFVVYPGSDGVPYTADDVINSFDTTLFNSFDPEGVDYNLIEDELYILDGAGSEVYVLSPGANGLFDGVTPDGDDILVNHFDTAVLGISKPEGIDYVGNPPINGRLVDSLLIVGPSNPDFLLETSDTGELLRLIDISFLNAIAPSGVTAPFTISPPEVDPGMDVYITDRGLPFNDPNGNDGKIYVIHVDSSVPSVPTPTPTSMATVTPTPTSTPVPSTLEVRVWSGSDDAEESGTGGMYLNSTDLELVYDGSNQSVGMRFNNISIPKGATITAAYLQFTVDELTSEATSLRIQAEASDNPSTFTLTARNISSRPRTAAFVNWSPPPWAAFGAGPDQRTPNLSPVFQEVIDRQGWASGNSLVVVITGSGRRVALAFEGSPVNAPLLHIEYTLESAPPTSTATSTPTATSTKTPTPTQPSLPTSTPTMLPMILVRVAAGSDDAEESATGWTYINSTDLELVYDGSNQTVGMRFNGLNIPRGAAIIRSYIQFTVDEASSTATNLRIGAEASDNPLTFATSPYNISSRPRTTAYVNWSPPAWATIGSAGLDQQTPDLSPILQEIVNRPGWTGGNAMAFMITGSGARVAVAYEGAPTNAPLLHVEYQAGSATSTPTSTSTSTAMAYTPTATTTHTPTPTPTKTNTPVPGSTATPTPTATQTPTRTATSMATATPTSTPTATPMPTATSAWQNLALNKPASVSSSQDGLHTGSQAVDGDTLTYWKSLKKSRLAAEWITVDLGSVMPIQQVILRWKNYYAVSYALLVSQDGVIWTAVYQTSQGDGGDDAISFGATSARFMRLESTSWSNATFRCWLSEFEIYSPQ